MILQVESHVGEPISTGDLKIIPLARSIRIHLPGLPGGLIWNRPMAIITQQPDGLEQVLPIHDITRQAQLGIFGIMTGILLILWVLRLKIKPNIH
jgi:hypothetical protein